MWHEESWFMNYALWIVHYSLKKVLMKINIKRIARKTDYTIGHLYVGGQYFCDTLEPADWPRKHRSVIFSWQKHVAGWLSPRDAIGCWSPRARVLVAGFRWSMVCVDLRVSAFMQEIGPLTPQVAFLWGGTAGWENWWTLELPCICWCKRWGRPWEEGSVWRWR